MPAVIGPYLINAVGKRHARRLALTMTRIRAVEALALGLVHLVCTADQLDTAIDACLQELVVGGPQVQREIKSFFSQLEVGPVTLGA